VCCVYFLGGGSMRAWCLPHAVDVRRAEAPRCPRLPPQTILRPRGQYLGGVPAVAWAQVQKDKSQFSFQGEWGGGGGGGVCVSGVML
jgi:hypothetical protein